MVDQASSGADCSACSRAPHYRPQKGVKPVTVLHTLTPLCERRPRSTVGVIGVFGAWRCRRCHTGVDPTPQATHYNAASACGLQSSPGGDVSASRASSARSLLRMQIMVQRRQRHLNILLLCSSGPARAASARHGSHMRTRATTACRRPEERASSFYVRLEISATTSATTTRVRDAILPGEDKG